MRKEFNFDSWENCFGRDINFCRLTMVLYWTVLVILGKAPNVLRISSLIREMTQSNWKRSLSFCWHWLFVWERNSVLKHEGTVLWEIWAFFLESYSDLLNCKTAKWLLGFENVISFSRNEPNQWKKKQKNCKQSFRQWVLLHTAKLNCSCHNINVNRGHTLKF